MCNPTLNVFLIYILGFYFVNLYIWTNPFCIVNIPVCVNLHFLEYGPFDKGLDGPVTTMKSDVLKIKNQIRLKNILCFNVPTSAIHICTG